MTDQLSFIDAVRAALADQFPTEIVNRVQQTPEGNVRVPMEIPRQYADRATRLALLRFEGPDFKVPCDTHARAVDWKQCAAIPVRDALNGRVCGKP